MNIALDIYKTKKTKYKLGTYLNIYKDGFLLTDCLGLIEGILWGYPDVKYGSNGIPDLNANGLKVKAKVKGDISTIPEVKGLIVQLDGSPGHVGIYLGNGYVLESTPKIFASGEGNGLVITQFKSKEEKNYRGTWETWLEYPYITYKRGDDMNDRYLNTDVFTYEQGKNENVVLLQYNKKIKLSQFVLNGQKPKAIMNCSYFTSDYVLGRNQGDMFNDTVNDNKYGQFIDLVLFKDGSYECKPMYSWEHTDKSKIRAGFSVATVLIRDGADVEENSTGISNSAHKFSNRDPQSAIAILDNKRVVFIVSEGRNHNDTGLNGYQLRNYVRKKYPNVELLCQLDGGGSSELIINGNLANTPSDGRERLMFNGLAIFENGVEQPQEQAKEEHSQFYLNFSKSIYLGTNVRSSRSITDANNKLGFARFKDNGLILVESCGYTPTDAKGQWCRTLQDIKLANGKVAPKGCFIRFDHEEGSYIE